MRNTTSTNSPCSRYIRCNGHYDLHMQDRLLPLRLIDDHVLVLCI